MKPKNSRVAGMWGRAQNMRPLIFACFFGFESAGFDIFGLLWAFLRRCFARTKIWTPNFLRLSMGLFRSAVGACGQGIVAFS